MAQNDWPSADGGRRFEVGGTYKLKAEIKGISGN